jgi:ankyrin repeat protein
MDSGNDDQIAKAKDRAYVPIFKRERTEPRIRTDIIAAVSSGSCTMVRELVRMGQPVNCKNQSDWTPLHFAAQRGDDEICAFLLESRADVDAKTKDNLWTCLHEAKNSAVSKLLLDGGASANAVDAWGQTPLHRACSSGRSDVAQVILPPIFYNYSARFWS